MCLCSSFTLRKPISPNVIWNRLQVQRIGQGRPRSQGSNDDIALIKIYRDVNFDGLLETRHGPALIGTGNLCAAGPDR